MEEKINQALDQIRPFLKSDGGNIELVEITDDNVVRVRLKGHCSDCPGAMMEIQYVIGEILKKSCPEIKRVESVQ